MSVYLDRAARCRALLNDPDADLIVRTVAGRLLRANVDRADTVLPIGLPSKYIEGSAGVRTLTDGATPAHAAAPDPMEGARHTVKRGRTKRGPTAVVTAYGLAHVVGEWHGAPSLSPFGSESYPVAAEMWERAGRLKRGARGVSALDIYRVTQALYGDVIPALLSTDNDMKHAVIHGDDSDTDDYGIAWHNPSDPFAAMDAQGRTVPDSPITYATRGYGLTFGLPSECIADRWKVAAWLQSKRDRSTADAGRIAASRRSTGLESSLHWKSRTHLPMPTPRKGDPTARRTALFDGYGVVAAVMLGHTAYRAELLAPDDRLRDAPPARMWRGHVSIIRPVPMTTVTDGKRARVARVKRTEREIHATTLPYLLARFALIAPGKRVKWTCGTRSGTFTRSTDGRMSVGTPDGPLVKSVRTVTAVERKLTAHLAA